MNNDCRISLVSKLKRFIPSQRERNKLLVEIARLCERSYRKGADHALRFYNLGKMLSRFSDEKLRSDWRKSDVRMSRGLLGERMTSKDRFLKDHPEWEFFDD